MPKPPLGPPPRFDLDPSRSTLDIFTYAEGFFSRLAHDLALRATKLEGHVQGARAELTVAAAGVRVLGVVRDGEVHDDVLSPADVASIERQVREIAFKKKPALRTRGVLEGGSVRFEIAGPDATVSVTAPVEASRASGGAHASGELVLSLRALGVPAIKGPLNAFRLADRLRVRFDLLFVEPLHQGLKDELDF